MEALNSAIRLIATTVPTTTEKERIVAFPWLQSLLWRGTTVAVRTSVVFLQKQEVNSVKVKTSNEGTERQYDVHPVWTFDAGRLFGWWTPGSGGVAPGVNFPAPILREANTVMINMRTDTCDNGE
jgi:hypothetical protein